jgi:hypothetical protein
VNLRSLVLTLVLAIAALTGSAAAASASVSALPQAWDPHAVAVNPDPSNTFLLRPGQIVVGPGDAPDVQRVLRDWRVDERHPYGLTLLTRTPADPSGAAKEVMAALATVRRATSARPQGPALVAPNYVFVGESVACGSAPISFTGEPRVQGGPGSTARPAKLPGALPLRTTDVLDGEGVTIAVLDTGMFDHGWLKSVQRAPKSDDVWDVEGDGYGDTESGHGTFIAGLIKQVAPAASIYAMKVLDSHGVGDDFTVATAMSQLPADTDIVNLSLGGYTDKNTPPIAIPLAMQATAQTRIVVAAAGNNAASRPFWPAAFEPVLAIGAADGAAGKWTPAPYSNFGPWVDAVARGSDLHSTFAHAKTKVAQGATASPSDPTVSFGGWASWDGTSFATPIAAAMIARTMTRDAFASPAEAAFKLTQTAPSASFASSPNAVLLDELEGRPF